MKKLVTFLFCLTISTALMANNAQLDAKIELNPSVIQPGTPISFSVKIKNSGNKENSPGSLFIRFVYPNPLANQAKSELYASEKIPLESIAPGSEISLVFKTLQKTPSLFDFIREDYGMRQYQAIAVIDDKEYMVGNRTLTFSATYYAGSPQEIAHPVP